MSPVPPVKVAPELVRSSLMVRVLEDFLKVPADNVALPQSTMFWLAPVPPSPSQVPPEKVRVEVVPEEPTVTDLELVSVSKVPAELVKVAPLESERLSTNCKVPAPEWVRL